MIKRSECRCICHTDAVALGLVVGPMHIVACCCEDKKYDEIINEKEEKEKFNVDKSKISIDKPEENVYYKQVWNDAIEKAALLVQPNPHIDEERRCEDVAAQIRLLKKV